MLLICHHRWAKAAQFAFANGLGLTFWVLRRDVVTILILHKRGCLCLAARETVCKVEHLTLVKMKEDPIPSCPRFRKFLNIQER